MTLSTRHLLDAAVAVAADEALDNATRMQLAGHFEPAVSVIERMLVPGCWQIGQHGVLAGWIGSLLPRLCWAVGRDCPAVGTHPVRTVEQVREWAQPVLEHELQLHPEVVDLDAVLPVRCLSPASRSPMRRMASTIIN